MIGILITIPRIGGPQAMAQALYRKYRPHRWEQVIGQEHIVQTLRNAIAAERVAHAYLFAGPRGTGKTTTARLLAKAVNCLDDNLTVRPCDQCEHCRLVNQSRFLDLIEIDAASNTSVDDVRDLREKINFSPNQGRCKVYIVDEVHMLSTAAFNALLKTLEEPPSHAIFVLATTEIHKIPATVLSRCQRHEFRRVPVKDLVEHLRAIAGLEGLIVEEEALTLISRQSTGAVRDAISLLDQLASTEQSITLDLVQAVLGTAASQAVVEVTSALLAQNATAGLEMIHRALDAGSDPRQFARQVVDYLRNVLLVRMGASETVDAPPEAITQMARHAGQAEVTDLLRFINNFNQAANEARSAWQPALPLEMAVVSSLVIASLADPAEPAGSEPGSPPKAPVRRGKTSRKATASANQQETTVAPPEGKIQETAGVELMVTEDGEPSSEDPEAGGEILNQIRAGWRQVMGQMRRRSRNTEALLRSGNLLGVKNNTIYLGFSAVLKPKMEQPENMALLEEILRTVLGQEIMVKCVVSTGRGDTLPPDVDSDGMVAAALRDLGGEIVDIQ